MVISTLPDSFRLAIPVRDLDMTEQFYADASVGNLPESGYHGDSLMTP
jgi:extradiol dioxygenase family protein